jgi:hypothetical protein
MDMKELTGVFCDYANACKNHCQMYVASLKKKSSLCYMKEEVEILL